MKTTRRVFSEKKNNAMVLADRKSVAQFWSKVRKTKDCWLWQGCTDGNGYGFFVFEGVQVRAHRFSLARRTKKAPIGMLAIHSCRNTNCVRPAHLRWGTAVENMADKKRDGTEHNVRGEANPAATITKAQVCKIWKLLLRKVSDREIARRFQINHWQVGHIRWGRTWKHVTATMQPLPRQRKMLTAKQACLIYQHVLDTSCTDISASLLFYVPKNTVNSIVNRATWAAATHHLPDIKKRSKGRPDLFNQRANAIALFRSGMTVARISQRLGVPYRYVLRLAQKEKKFALQKLQPGFPQARGDSHTAT